MAEGDARRPEAGVLGALVLVQVLFGLHYVAAKELLRWIDPAAWSLLRVVGAAVVLRLVVLRRRAPAVEGPREWLVLTGFALCGVVFNQVLFVEGLARTTPAHSALIATTIPLWTILFAVMLGQERFTRSRVAGLALALGGAWVLLQADRFHLEADLLLGDLLTLGNSLSFSFFLAVSRRYLLRRDPLVTTARIFAIGTLGIALYGVGPLLSLRPSELPAIAWPLGLFIVLGPTAATYALNYWSLQRVSSSLVALFIYLQPVIATALQWALGRGAPGGRFYLAAALVFAGVGVGSLRPRARSAID